MSWTETYFMIDVIGTIIGGIIGFVGIVIIYLIKWKEKK